MQTALSHPLSEYLYLSVIVTAFLSFWYSSLFVFNHKTEVKSKSRLWLRSLLIITWNFSYYCILMSERLESIELGFALAVLGVTIFWWSARHLQRNRSTGAGSVSFDVIFSKATPNLHFKTGPFRVVRHPFYTSYMLVYGSLLVSTPSLVLRLLCLVIIAYYIAAARNEEKAFLQSEFAESYRNYQKTAGMFFPKLWRREIGGG